MKKEFIRKDLVEEAEKNAESWFQEALSTATTSKELFQVGIDKRSAARDIEYNGSEAERLVHQLTYVEFQTKVMVFTDQSVIEKLKNHREQQKEQTV